jgi:transaldolase
LKTGFKTPVRGEFGLNHSKGIETMKENPLKQLEALGQSLWLDDIGRALIKGGALRRMIAEDGLRGMTSNPAIFEKAIVGSRDYEKDIQSMAGNGSDAREIYEAISQQDVRNAAAEFLPLYEKTEGRDGYVSLEVNPRLARDTQGTVAEACRLWGALDLPNVLIKIPATKEGLPAIRELIAEGINVNVTLLFGLPRYREAAEAYLAGLEARSAKGKPVRGIASVASFFISRIDSLVDPLLDEITARGGKAAEGAKKAKGQVAIASGKRAYQIFKGLFGGARFKKLASKGAMVQRLLWASTGTKNPDYSDVKYAEALIGPDTVNTVPHETLDAYRDHGAPKATLEQDGQAAREIMEGLGELGIQIDQVAQQLEDEGVQKFIKPFDKLMAALA